MIPLELQADALNEPEERPRALAVRGSALVYEQRRVEQQPCSPTQGHVVTPIAKWPAERSPAHVTSATLSTATRMGDWDTWCGEAVRADRFLARCAADTHSLAEIHGPAARAQHHDPVGGVHRPVPRQEALSPPIVVRRIHPLMCRVSRERHRLARFRMVDAQFDHPGGEYHARHPEKQPCRNDAERNGWVHEEFLGGSQYARAAARRRGPLPSPPPGRSSRHRTPAQRCRSEFDGGRLGLLARCQFHGVFGDPRLRGAPAGDEDGRQEARLHESMPAGVADWSNAECRFRQPVSGAAASVRRTSRGRSEFAPALAFTVAFHTTKDYSSWPSTPSGAFADPSPSPSPSLSSSGTTRATAVTRSAPSRFTSRTPCVLRPATRT